MDDVRRDAHAAQAERAERLAVKARWRTASVRAAAERHERSAGDPVTGEGHRRAVEFYRDAQVLYEQAAALQSAHAAHERQAADAPISAHQRLARHQRQPAPTPFGRSDRSAALVRREALADQRDRAADARERAADERDRIAYGRDIVADDRDAVATAREDQIDARERESGDALLYPRFSVEQRAQLARVHAAIVRSRERLVTAANALDRDDPPAVDETAIDRHLAGLQRRQRAEPE